MNRQSQSSTFSAGLVLPAIFALIAACCVSATPGTPSGHHRNSEQVVSLGSPELSHGDGTHVDPPVSLQFEEEWRRDELPPNTTVIFKGGGFRGSGFPAVSSDGSRIALLYDGTHPLVGGYPTFELWSTQPIKRLRQIPLLSTLHGPGTLVDATDSSEAIDTIRQNIAEVNRILGQNDFTPIASLFDRTTEYGPLVNHASNGKIINYPGTDGSASLEISSLRGNVELKLAMPIIPVITQSEIPLNNCSVQGSPTQAWYVPQPEIVVVRITFISARDGCEQPEEWLLRRL